MTKCKTTNDSACQPFGVSVIYDEFQGARPSSRPHPEGSEAKTERMRNEVTSWLGAAKVACDGQVGM